MDIAIVGMGVSGTSAFIQLVNRLLAEKQSKTDTKSNERGMMQPREYTVYLFEKPSHSMGPGYCLFSVLNHCVAIADLRINISLSSRV
jgi:hypothetical protein